MLAVGHYLCSLGRYGLRVRSLWFADTHGNPARWYSFWYSFLPLKTH